MFSMFLLQEKRDTDSPDRWPVRGNRSPPHASAFSSVTTQASSSSSSTEAVSMLPLKQLRTALLGDRHGAKVHRAFSDVNPPWSHESMAHLAEASQMSASSLASPEKAVPRLPAKKRKFDWGSGSADGDRTNAKISLPCALPSRYLGGVNGDTQGTPVLQQPTSLIVDKPTQQLASGSGGGGGEARKSTGPFADTNAAPFYYPTSHIPPKQEPSPVKQRKLSYPDLSFTSDPSNLFSRSPSISPSRAPAPPPPPSSSSVLSAFSMRGDLSSRRSSLVVDVNSSSISGSNTSSYQARSSLPTRGDSFRPKGNFSSPPPPPPPPPPLNRYPSHHSEAGRRYSVFGAPSGLSLAARGDFEHAVAEPASGSTAYVARRHSSVLSTARYASSSVSDSSFRPPHEKRAYNQPQFPVKRVPIESSPLFESGGLAESRPLSAPDDKIPNFSAPHHRSSPVKAEPPAPNPS
uniref:WH2 domain-containing protein n=1 Tax=Mesocestoides corti TaxID=53468 RepID=A0A5K3FKQ1_MESCO